MDSLPRVFKIRQKIASPKLADVEKEMNALLDRFGLAGKVKSGERIAILAQNCIEYYDTYFGNAKSGAITVPLNWRLAPPEIQFILENSRGRNPA